MDQSKQFLVRTIDILQELDRHPIRELVAIADSTQDEKFKVLIWERVLSHIEGTQPEAQPLTPRTPEESVARIRQKLADLYRPKTDYVNGKSQS